MAKPRSTSLLMTLTFTLLTIMLFSSTDYQTQAATLDEDLEWPVPLSMYNGVMDESVDFDDGFVDLDGNDEIGSTSISGHGHGHGHGRSLFWRRVVHYYISYGALSANRIPCPPRSGRSYYTHNCFKSRAPVNPYSRGCSRITRCRR